MIKAASTFNKAHYHPDDGGSTHLWNVGRYLLTTRQYIPEDSELHTRRRENLKSLMKWSCPATAMQATRGRGTIAPTHSRPKRKWVVSSQCSLCNSVGNNSIGNKTKQSKLCNSCYTTLLGLPKQRLGASLYHSDLHQVWLRNSMVTAPWVTAEDKRGHGLSFANQHTEGQASRFLKIAHNYFLDFLEKKNYQVTQHVRSRLAQAV
jgi:hypothetical protein